MEVSNLGYPARRLIFYLFNIEYCKIYVINSDFNQYINITIYSIYIYSNTKFNTLNTGVTWNVLQKVFFITEHLRIRTIKVFSKV